MNRRTCATDRGISAGVLFSFTLLLLTREVTIKIADNPMRRTPKPKGKSPDPAALKVPTGILSEQ
jgi:hypothetical protein